MFTGFSLTISPITGDINTGDIHLQEQQQVIIEDYFTFATKLGNYNYARWCAWGYEPKTWSEENQKRVGCSKKSFDCWWVIKAYGFIKWIFTKKEIWHLNSEALYKLAKPVAPAAAQRWDYTFRTLVWWSGAASTHWAFVYTPLSWNKIAIFDWLDWKFKSRELIVRCNKFYCTYNTDKWRYKIKFSTNPLVEVATSWNIEVFPFVTTTPTTGKVQASQNLCVSNPKWYHITLDWYAYDSVANDTINRWYVRNRSIDMIATYLCEHWGFDPKVKSLTNDSWICQLHYNKTNAYWIDNPLWKTLDFQKQACLDKRNLVQDKNLWSCYKKRASFIKKINYLTWWFRDINSK
jgi:hypothetical protein